MDSQYIETPVQLSARRTYRGKAANQNVLLDQVPANSLYRPIPGRFEPFKERNTYF